VHDRRDVALAKVADRLRTVDRQVAERVVELSRDPGRLLVRDRIVERHRVRDLGYLGGRRRGDEERKEPAREAGRPAGLEVHVRRQLTTPSAKHQVVVPVDDHGRSS